MPSALSRVGSPCFYGGDEALQLAHAQQSVCPFGAKMEWGGDNRPSPQLV